MYERVDCVVIGAGVIGLAVARELVSSGFETVLLEKTYQIGNETSSRNSEVIHAGIYYAPGSLKARFCVEGKAALYQYCAERDVAHKQCGKLIVATNQDQVKRLENIRKNAFANGVRDLQLLTEKEALALEPALSCCAALLSPSTGIIDSHALMMAIQADFERQGGVVALGSPLLSARVIDEGLLLHVGGNDEIELLAGRVVNCAGLHAQEVARCIQGIDVASVAPSFYAKGNYFALNQRSPFKHLIYPVPASAGLGVHLTFDLGGGVRFGPDVEWVDDIEYEVSPERAAGFYAEIRKYWPAMQDDSLSPAYAGIRPKTAGAGSPAQDFVFHSEVDHGIKGLINLYGIESPGLTSSFSIAKHVKGLLEC